jgi:hypothetical protein
MNTGAQLYLLHYIFPSNTKNTVHFFYRSPQHRSRHGIYRRMQAFCEIKLPCGSNKMIPHNYRVMRKFIITLIQGLQTKSFLSSSRNTIKTVLQECQPLEVMETLNPFSFIISSI